MDDVTRANPRDYKSYIDSWIYGHLCSFLNYDFLVSFEMLVIAGANKKIQLAEVHNTSRANRSDVKKCGELCGETTRDCPIIYRSRSDLETSWSHLSSSTYGHLL